ncbi:MAG: FUSC family protein [Cellulosilyticaceae bacterium]
MSNSIVAVSIVVMALSLVAIDLKENLVKKTFYISLVLLTLGVAATFMNLNPILGLVINLVVIFFIVYEGCHSYKENMYFPFLLGYMFMGLSAPAPLGALPLRMVALFVGCIYILLIQLVLNRGRFHKTVFHTKKQLLAFVLQQLDGILNGTVTDASPKAIYPLTKPIVRALYDTRGKGKVLLPENKGKLLVVLNLEALYKALCSLSTSALTPQEKDYLTQFKDLLQQLDAYFYSTSDKVATKECILSLWDTLHNAMPEERLYPLLDAIKDLPQALDAIGNATPDADKAPCSFRTFFKPLEPHSPTFKFALKVAVSLSIIILLSDLWSLTYGRWMIFPLIAIIQPYMDGTKKKAFDRIIGTFLGILLFVPIFAVVEDNMIRLNITIFLAYINLFMKKYYISTALIAVSALGSVAMGGNAGTDTLILRIFFTVVGCVLGLLINKYVFPQTLSQYTDGLVKEYEDSMTRLQHTSETPLSETQRDDLILKTKLLEYEIYEKI